MRKDILNYFLTIISLQQVYGHGRLEDPPARNAAWRFGFNVPPNYDDVGLNCGGLSIQKANDGKCGVCGDSYSGSRDHEQGGKYATNTIVRTYAMNSMIDVKILLTANHVGFMELRLCPSTNPYEEITQECLDKHLLYIEGFGSQYPVNEGTDSIHLRAHLPAGLSCTHCVLQWRYHAGNSWGTDHISGKSCLGCGYQEEFYNCADISILSNENEILVPSPMNTKTATTTTTTEEPLIHHPHHDPIDLATEIEKFSFFLHSDPTTSTTESTSASSSIEDASFVYSFQSGNDMTKSNKTHRCYPTNEVLKPLVGIEHWCLKLCLIHCPPTLCACVPI